MLTSAREDMFIEANGNRFHYRIDGGPDRPWLMFSNSLATNLSMWDAQAAHFATDYRVLRYDQRGHGQTEAPSGPYDFGLLIADVVGLMDALMVERVSFCGLSMGGVTAMGVGLLHPDRLDSVIVCDSPCVSTLGSARMWFERIDQAESQGMDALVESTMARWFSPVTLAAKPPYLAKVREMIRTTPVAGFAGCSAALADHDFRSGAGKLSRPVLFVTGSHDPAAVAMREMQAEVAGAHFAELSGAGHISNMDQPARFNQAVEAFLRS
jgi:3-oxoadipate enol-lactonase